MDLTLPTQLFCGAMVESKSINSWLRSGRRPKNQTVVVEHRNMSIFSDVESATNHSVVVRVFHFANPNAFCSELTFLTLYRYFSSFFLLLVYLFTNKRIEPKQNKNKNPKPTNCEQMRSGEWCHNSSMRHLKNSIKYILWVPDYRSKAVKCTMYMFVTMCVRIKMRKNGEFVLALR